LFLCFSLKRIVIFSFIIIIIVSLSVATPIAVNVSKSVDDKDIKVNWVDFNITYQALSDTLEADINSYNNGTKISWIDLLAYLSTKYGGNFKKYKKSDLINLISQIKDGNDIEEMGNKLGNFKYYKEAYGAVLDGFVGEFEGEGNDKENKTSEKKYGLKVFSPIAKGYSYSHYDDFGSSRSYGFRRKHLGHDMMGGIGTPIIAVESGIVENVGWNQYGGWRIGIRSFDKKRYHYYAHLRKDHPYNDIYEGKIIKAGDVIGYLGMTGYSTKENVNNINVPHLHYGIELIFDEKKREEKYEIWIDVYALVKLLEKNKSEVYKSENEFYRKNDIFFPETNE